MFVCARVWLTYVGLVKNVFVAVIVVVVPCGVDPDVPHANVIVVPAVPTQDTRPWALMIACWLGRCQNPAGSHGWYDPAAPDAPVAATTRACAVLTAAAACTQPTVAFPAAW